MSHIARYVDTTAAAVPIARSEAVDAGCRGAGDPGLTAVGVEPTWGSASRRRHEAA